MNQTYRKLNIAEHCECAITGLSFSTVAVNRHSHTLYTPVYLLSNIKSEELVCADQT